MREFFQVPKQHVWKDTCKILRGSLQLESTLIGKNLVYIKRSNEWRVSTTVGGASTEKNWSRHNFKILLASNRNKQYVDYLCLPHFV